MSVPTSLTGARLGLPAWKIHSCKLLMDRTWDDQGYALGLWRAAKTPRLESARKDPRPQRPALAPPGMPLGRALASCPGPRQPQPSSALPDLSAPPWQACSAAMGVVVRRSRHLKRPPFTLPIIERGGCGILAQIRDSALMQLCDGCTVDALLFAAPRVVKCPFRGFYAAQRLQIVDCPIDDAAVFGEPRRKPAFHPSVAAVDRSEALGDDAIRSERCEDRIRVVRAPAGDILL
jgi:hypothetical protein